jgi:hypothetical protein
MQEIRRLLDASLLALLNPIEQILLVEWATTSSSYRPAAPLTAQISAMISLRHWGAIRPRFDHVVRL